MYGLVGLISGMEMYRNKEGLEYIDFGAIVDSVI
jgi:hypothetical protein